MRKSLIVYSSYILIVSLLCSIYLIFPNLYSFSLVLFFPSRIFLCKFFQNYFILRISGKILLLPIYISIISFAPLLAFIYFAVFCFQLNFQIKRLKLKQNKCCCSKLKLLHNTQKYDENKVFEFINFEWLREKEEVYVYVRDGVVWSNNVLSKFIFFFRILFFQIFLIFDVLSNKSSFEIKPNFKRTLFGQTTSSRPKQIDWSNTFFRIAFLLSLT